MIEYEFDQMFAEAVHRIGCDPVGRYLTAAARRPAALGFPPFVNSVRAISLPSLALRYPLPLRCRLVPPHQPDLVQCPVYRPRIPRILPLQLPLYITQRRLLPTTRPQRHPYLTSRNTALSPTVLPLPSAQPAPSPIPPGRSVYSPCLIIARTAATVFRLTPNSAAIALSDKSGFPKI